MRAEDPRTRAIEAIVDAARWSPSGDNTQPVRFRVEPGGGSIAVVLDPSRDRSPMNAGQAMARIAAGAALENLARAAGARGLVAVVEPGPPGTLAVVRLSGEPTGGGPADATLAARVTNRRAYDGRPVGPDVLGRLEAGSPGRDGVATLWIVDRARVESLAGLIGRADGIMFGEPTMRRAFLEKVRFDAPARARVEEGLSLGSLEATAPQRLALRAIRRLPDAAFRLGGAARIFADQARRMVRSASGLALVVAPDGSEWSDLAVGRAMQRAWLALTAEGLAAQPMMSLPVLENVADRGEPGLRSALGPDKLDALRAGLRTLVPEIGDRRPAWLMRFGHAPPPTGRTGRLPTSSLLLGPADDRPE